MQILSNTSENKYTIQVVVNIREENFELSTFHSTIDMGVTNEVYNYNTNATS